MIARNKCYFQNKQHFVESRPRRTSSCGKQNVTANGVGSFRKKPFSRGYQSRMSCLLLISYSKRKGTINNNKLAWRKWSSLRYERVIEPFNVMWTLCLNYSTTLSITRGLEGRRMRSVQVYVCVLLCIFFLKAAVFDVTS